MEDVQAALGNRDVHDVLRADVDRHTRFWKDDKVVAVYGALVLDRVVFHLERKVMRVSAEKQPLDKLQRAETHLQFQVPSACSTVDPFDQWLPHSMNLIEVVHLATEQLVT